MTIGPCEDRTVPASRPGQKRFRATIDGVEKGRADVVLPFEAARFFDSLATFYRKGYLR